MNKKILLSAAVCACLLAGCKEKMEELKGSIKIVSISPEPTVALKVGEKIEMQAEVEYDLNWADGYTDLVVQQKNAQPIAYTTGMVTLKKGAGKITLKQSFTVPDTAEVHVFVPLHSGTPTAGRENSTGLVDTRTYNVIQKKK